MRSCCGIERADVWREEAAIHVSPNDHSVLVLLSISYELAALRIQLRESLALR